MKRLGVTMPKDRPSSCSSAVIFHDAWPTTWPRLIVDIVNNHHPDYYQGDSAIPPGDWESPRPVYFLAVPPSQEFDFALAKRRAESEDHALTLAQEWLMGALTHLGAGAKTAAGYGAFRVMNQTVAPLSKPARETFEATLELVTPAFLAGANQSAEDCDLRPATLRGLLRWWWRTMHSGFVDVPTLARMEAALWGNTNSGSPIRVTVQPASGIEPLRFDKNVLQTQNRLPKPPNSKTTQGLWYHSFGMDDTKSESGVRSRFQRWYLVPGTRWQV